MRRFTGIATILMLWSGLAITQNASPDQHIAMPEELIKAVIEQGTLEGEMQKQFGKMSDAAGSTITRVFAGKSLTRLDMNAALEIITSAFADPRYVPIQSDRQPRTTLLLLRYLDFWTTDPAVKRDIAHTRRYVEEQYQKSLTPAK